MSKWDKLDKEKTIDQLSNPNPVTGNKTWLRHKADSESGLIDIMILDGKLSVDQMIDKLINNPALTAKKYRQWEKRIKDHILHLSTKEGDSRNRASGDGGHNLRIGTNEFGAIFFDL